MNNDIEITLLSKEEIWGKDQLEVLKKYRNIAAITDLVVLTGGYCEDTCIYRAPDDDTLKGRTGLFYTRSDDGDGDVRSVNGVGFISFSYRFWKNGTIRPVFRLSSSLFSQITKNRVMGYNGVEEVEFSEYPQYAPDLDMQRRLESAYQVGILRKNSRYYTFDRTEDDECYQPFNPIKYEEYEYQGKRYIRVKANSDYDGIVFRLSNCETYKDGDYVWVEVTPVVWLIDDKTKTLISKRGLLSGIRFNDKEYDGVFENTKMYRYIHDYMLRDLLQREYNKKIESILDETYTHFEEISDEISPEDREAYLEALKSLREKLKSNHPKKK